MAIVFLNGCTSAGKSSIAVALQDRLAEPHLRIGIDDAFAMIPRRLHNHPDGFFFDFDDDGRVRLNFGPFGVATLHAYHRSVAAIAKSGLSLIVDEVILTRDLLIDWIAALGDCDVFVVGVQCELAELERREIARGDRLRGQAKGQFNVVHADMHYDLEVDSTATSATALADRIVLARRDEQRHRAWSRMRQTLGGQTPS